MNSSQPYPKHEQPKEAWCDPTHLHVLLRDGRTVSTPLWWYPSLEAATPAQRNDLTLSLSGVHWDAVDEDLSVKGMLEGWRYPSAIKPEKSENKNKAA
ncbi:MAG: DUF2442 domain-containing protein [Pseudomonadota bacterium]